MRDLGDDNRTSLQDQPDTEMDEEQIFDEGGAGARLGQGGNFGEGWEAGYGHGYKDGYDHAKAGQPFDGDATAARLRYAGDDSTDDQRDDEMPDSGGAAGQATRVPTETTAAGGGRT
jgi:hypothetical protein